jgi:hypothetical protein
MRRPANDEMVQGFRDGYDADAPEPSANRSASYRHGFMCARIDKGKIANPGFDALERAADAASELSHRPRHEAPDLDHGHAP